MAIESERLLIHQIYGDYIPHQDELADDDPFKELAENLVVQFDACVDYLRLKFPDEHINRLMAHFWRSVGKKVTPAMLNSAVDRLHVWTEKRGKNKIGSVMVPAHWLDMVIEDPYMQLGGLVYCASLARDYVRAFVEKPPLITYEIKKVEKRARRYEAEFYLTLLQIEPDFHPNEYQQKLLDEFPRGMAN